MQAFQAMFELASPIALAVFIFTIVPTLFLYKWLMKK